MMWSLLPLLFVLPTALGALISPRNTTTYACNNSPDLCNRSYSNITQLGAHDSPFDLDSSSTSNTISFSDASNQNINSTAQLSAGVRFLSAQVHNNNGAWHLCHTSCGLLDAGTLSSWLSGIKTWLDANPHDVVTLLLVNSDNASANDLDQEFSAANIKSYGYVPPSTSAALQTWPTLQELINNSTRLITFVASLTESSSAPYLLDEFTFVFENPYNVTSLSNFSCVADRPSSVSGQTETAVASGRLPLMNHFLDENMGTGIFAPDTGNITTTNARTGEGSLGVSASTCTTTYGRPPAVVLVDFFDQGQTLQVVDGINGITATGRTTSSSGAKSASSSGSITVRGDRWSVMGVSLLCVAAVVCCI